MFFLMVYTYSKGPTSMKHRRNRDLLSAFAIEITQICMLDFGDFFVFGRYVLSYPPILVSKTFFVKVDL